MVRESWKSQDMGWLKEQGQRQRQPGTPRLVLITPGCLPFPGRVREGEGSYGEPPACDVWGAGFASHYNRIDGGGISRDPRRQLAGPSEGRMIQVCIQQVLKGGEEGGSVTSRRSWLPSLLVHFSQASWPVSFPSPNPYLLLVRVACSLGLLLLYWPLGLGFY